MERDESDLSLVDLAEEDGTSSSSSSSSSDVLTSPRGKKRKIALSKQAAEELLETVEETEEIQKELLSQWLLPSQQSKLMSVLQESRRELEERMRAQIEASEGLDDDDDDEDYTPTDEEKHNAVVQTRSILNNLQSAIDNIFSDDSMTQLAAMSRWRTLLSVCDVFRSAYEKLQISDLLVSIFNAIAETDVVPRFLYFLGEGDRPSLQWEALDALTYIAPGLRIVGIPEDSEWHPSNMLSQKMIIDNGGVETLIDLMENSDQELIKAHAVKVLVSLCSHCTAARDYVLSKDIMDPLFAMTEIENIELARNITQLLSYLCRTKGMKGFGDQILPEIQHYLDAEDTQLLSNTIQLMTIYPDDVNPELSARIIELVSCEARKVRLVALKTIKTVFAHGNVSILDDGGLQSLIELLPNIDDEKTLISTLDVIGTVAHAEGEFVEALFDLDLLTPLSPLLEEGTVEVRRAATRIVTFMTRYASDTALFDTFVNEDFIDMQCAELDNWRILDVNLKPTFALAFMRDSLEVLFNILSAGEREEERTTNNVIVVNDNAQLFCDESIDRLIALHLQIRHQPEPSVRMYSQEFAKKIAQLLKMIRMGFDDNDEVSTRLQTLMSLHFTPEEIGDEDDDISDTQSDAGMDLQAVHGNMMDRSTRAGGDFNNSKYRHDTKVPVKTYFKLNGVNDHRMFYLPRNISFAEFKDHIEQEYNCPLSLFYKDGQELCTIRSNASLESAFTFVEIQRRRANQQNNRRNNNNNRNNRRFNNNNRRRNNNRGGMDTESTSGGNGNGNGNSGSSGVLKVLCRVPDENSSSSRNFRTHHKTDRKKKENLFQALGKQSKFDEGELDDLLQFWNKRAHNGLLDREEFGIGMRNMGIDTDNEIDEAFKAFDVDGDGTVDLREVILGLSTMKYGSFDDRLQLAFRAYDDDRSGYISKDEVKQMFVASMKNQGLDPEEDEDLVDAQVDECFELVDLNGDGQLDYEEFKRGVQNSVITNAFGF